MVLEDSWLKASKWKGKARQSYLVHWAQDTQQRKSVREKGPLTQNQRLHLQDPPNTSKYAPPIPQVDHKGNHLSPLF